MASTTLAIQFSLSMPLDEGCSATLTLPEGFGSDNLAKVSLLNGVREEELRFTEY